ncbi:MAG: glycosyltransferase family protein [Planctomycetota bacterium]|jgi:glycosyltransferase involved in cell wall biosynthesis
MPYNIRIVSTYPPRRCGIGTFSRDLANALENFTGEVGSIRVAAIDSDSLPYNIPVDLVIDQYNPESWRYAIKDITARANESPNPTIVLLQHEYGLDPDENGEYGAGTNFIDMARTFQEKGLTTLVYLHTVLDEPNEQQKKILQVLAKSSDSLVVTTESAINILASDTYGIDPSKLKHIDHGIRMQHPSQYDRLTIKEQYGLQNRLLVTTLGLLSPDKGIQYGIRAYGRFLQESCSDSQRSKIVYLIAGQTHPDFVRKEGGRQYREYETVLAAALQSSELKWCKVKELGTTDFGQYDVVFFDSFLDESTMLKLYGATNVMILPYLNMQQISSGILADTLGSGRVAVATKFRYAVELIHSNKACPGGVIIGRHARGILVDSDEPCVEQIAQALDYLVFNKGKRLRMEKQAHQRGYQMRWNNTAWALLQHIEFLREEKEIVTGRGITFTRDKKSVLQKIKRPTGS